MTQTVKPLNVMDWISAGYNKCLVSERLRPLNKGADFILQKLISDSVGKKYFIVVYCYYTNNTDDPVSFMACAQFTPEDNQAFFDITVNYPNKVVEAEQFFEQCWHLAGSPYYDVFV